MVNINRKQYDSREISKLWGIVIMILTSMIVAVFTCLYVYFYEPPIYILLTLGGILAGVGGIILFKIYRHNRRLEKVDKGNKLLVIEQRVIDIPSKGFYIRSSYCTFSARYLHSCGNYLGCSYIDSSRFTFNM